MIEVFLFEVLIMLIGGYLFAKSESKEKEIAREKHARLLRKTHRAMIENP